MAARRQRLLTLIYVAFAMITAGGLFAAATLAPAPPAVLPLAMVVCIGAPMLAAWELRAAITRSRRPATPLDESALANLRRRLDELPETQHPLGL